MKSTTLINILSTYQPSSKDEALEVAAMLDDIRSIESNDFNAGFDSADVAVIDFAYLLDVFNEHTYDDYGKACRLSGSRLDIDTYAFAISDKSLVSAVGPSVVDGACQFIGDLWQDNEEAGANRPDGKFDNDHWGRDVTGVSREYTTEK